MSYVFSAPGKTFLFGEYLALNGGPAIVASTGPRFELKVSKGEGLCHDIHPKSLAGLWMRANAFDFSNVDIEFIDEEVIFLGPLPDHYGHFITEGLSRLWPYLDSKYKDYGVYLILLSLVFIVRPNSLIPSLIFMYGLPVGSMIYYDKKRS